MASITCDLCEAELGHKVYIPLEDYEMHRLLVHNVKQPFNKVQFYSEHAKALEYSQRHKVEEFLENDCIQYAGDGIYVCKPIKGYNKTVYQLTKNESGEFTCTCQYNALYGRFCSHLGALYEYFKRQDKKAQLLQDRLK